MFRKGKLPLQGRIKQKWCLKDRLTAVDKSNELLTDLNVTIKIDRTVEILVEISPAFLSVLGTVHTLSHAFFWNSRPPPSPVTQKGSNMTQFCLEPSRFASLSSLPPSVTWICEQSLICWSIDICLILLGRYESLVGSDCHRCSMSSAQCRWSIWRLPDGHC